MSNIIINIKFFGSFRKFGSNIAITVPEGSSVIAVKEALALVLGGEDTFVIEASVLANDNEILQGDTVFNEDTQLSILPPVCGG